MEYMRQEERMNLGRIELLGAGEEHEEEFFGEFKREAVGASGDPWGGAPGTASWETDGVH